MKTRDKIQTQNIGGISLPKLHGHTKIILTDVKTGEKEVVEKDNLVTGAVAQLFAQNVFGAKNYDEMTPLRDMFGGVMCFEDVLDVSDTLVANDDSNALIAHAGQTSHSSASTTRGNPNGVLSEEIAGGKGYKFVWDFSTSQGNGTISSLSLTHKWLGDIGLKPVAAVTGETLLFDNSNKTKIFQDGGTYPTFDQAYHCLLSVDFENSTGLHAYLADESANTTLVITEIEASFLKQGVNESLGECKVLDTHTITLTRAYRARNSAVCADLDNNKIYVINLGTSAGHTINIDVIDTTTWTATAQTITEASMDLGFFNNYTEATAGVINKVIVSNGYLYVPNDTYRSFYKVNLSNAADITLLTSTLTEDINLHMCGMTEVSEGLIYGANFIINGGNVYPSQFVEANLKSATSSRQWQYRKPVIRFLRVGEWFEWVYENDSDYGAKYYLASGFALGYLGTIQNLDNAVTKTNDKTMQIQYSLTIAE